MSLGSKTKAAEEFKMGILKLSNGMEIDVSGGLRVVELEDRILVIGQEMAIRVNSVQEGWEEIRKQKENEC
jgi:hypothetical protein